VGHGVRHDPFGQSLGALDVESLTVAMAIAPGVYSRNRFFDLFKTTEVRRARTRAAVVRGIVQHLALLHREGGDVAVSVGLDRHDGRVGFRYRVPALCFERKTDLTELETSCVLYLAERAGLPGLAPSSSEKEGLHGALRRLSGREATRLMR